MRKCALALAALAAVGFSVTAFAEDGPRAMTDAEMDQVAAGVVIISGLTALGQNLHTVEVPPTIPSSVLQGTRLLDDRPLDTPAVSFENR
jgi:hypothetical protein